jgi:hypothetical protein
MPSALSAKCRISNHLAQYSHPDDLNNSVTHGGRVRADH